MKYRKKPVIVDAMVFEYGKGKLESLIDFCEGNLGAIRKDRHIGALAEAEIGTLEDGKTLVVKHIATEGDYIIKGVAGEFYACKPDIFHKTYELVGPTPNIINRLKCVQNGKPGGCQLHNLHCSFPECCEV